MNHDFLETPRGRELQERFNALKAELAALGWLTHGSVTPNHPGNWRWTTKVKAKTVSLTLSPEQAELFRIAIANHRKLEAILHEMRAISHEVLLSSAPRTRKKSQPKIPPKSALS